MELLEAYVVDALLGIVFLLQFTQNLHWESKKVSSMTLQLK